MTRSHGKHGDGTYRQLPSQRWEWRISAKVQGSSRRLTGTADTEPKARAAARKAKVEVEGGRLAANHSTLLGPHLEKWLAGRRIDLSVNTQKKYSDLLRLHILPQLGSVKLVAVTPALLREHYGELRAKTDKKPGLGYSSIRQIHDILHAGLARAVADKLLVENPAAALDVRPRQAGSKIKAIRYFTREQAIAFLKAADAPAERPGQVLAFLLFTGMRRGEALGLRWDLVNLTGNPPLLRVEMQRTVSGATIIEGPPKTANAIRPVPLSPEVVALLKRVKERTTEEWQALYPDAPISPYVFPNLAGQPYDPSNFTRVMKRLCKTAQVTQMSPHSLRHTYASLAALKGIRIEVLSKLLGHASPAFTLTQYRHLYPEELAPFSLDLSDFSVELED